MKSARLAVFIAIFTVASLGRAQTVAPVYEGFNYTSGQSILTVSSTATGLSGDWVSTTGGITGTTDGTGLTFGSLQTSGGALDVTSSGPNDWAYLAAPIGVSLTNGSTLYSSYLFQYNGAGGDGSAANFGVAVGTSTGANHIFSLMENQYGSNPTSGRIAFDDGTRSALVYSQSINSGDTFLFIGEWTNLGGASTGTGWVLSLADFNAISGAPITDVALDANNISHATVPGTAGAFTTSDFAKIGDFIGGSIDYKVDEIRYSNNLADVVPVSVPVPEPSTYAIFFGAACAGFAGLRRRKLAPSN